MAIRSPVLTIVSFPGAIVRELTEKRSNPAVRGVNLVGSVAPRCTLITRIWSAMLLFFRVSLLHLKLLSKWCPILLVTRARFLLVRRRSYDEGVMTSDLLVASVFPGHWLAPFFIPRSGIGRETKGCNVFVSIHLRFQVIGWPTDSS